MTLPLHRELLGYFVPQSSHPNWIRISRAGQVAADDFTPTRGLVVAKEKIAANGDFNLSGERYRETGALNHAFPLVRLGECEAFEIKSGGTPKSDVADYWDGDVAWATLVDLPATDFISQITSTKRSISEKGLAESSAELLPANSVIVSTRATIGRIAINRIPIATNQGFKNVVIRDHGVAMPEYVALALTRLVPTMQSWATGGTFAEISKKQFSELEIPLPPLEVQKEIVAEIEAYQKVIDGARAVLDHYRPHIPINPEWPMVELGEVMQRYNDIIHPGDRTSGELTFVGMEHIEEGTGRRIGSTQVDLARMTGRKPTFKKGQIIYGYLRPYLNKVWIAEFDGCSSVDQFALEVDAKRAEPKYVAMFLRSDAFLAQSGRSTTNAQLPRISIGEILGARIPLPPLAEQEKIVAEIETEQRLVEANRQLIERMEQRIAATLARIWGEDHRPAQQPPKSEEVPLGTA